MKKFLLLIILTAFIGAGCTGASLSQADKDLLAQSLRASKQAKAAADSAAVSVVKAENAAERAETATERSETATERAELEAKKTEKIFFRSQKK